MAATAAETARVELPVVAAGQAVRRYPLPAASTLEEVMVLATSGMTAPVAAAVPAFQQTRLVPTAVVAEAANPVQHEAAAAQTVLEVQIAY